MTVEGESIEKRLKALRQRMDDKGIDVSLLWDPDNEYYLSGFRAISYSRPIVLIVYKEKTQYIIPALENDHAREKAKVDEFFVYHEKIQNRHMDTTYLQPLQRILNELTKDKVFGLELDIVPAFVYRLLQEKGFEIKDIGQDLIDLRAIKDKEEIYWLEQAGRLSDIALEASFANVKAGMSELEFDSFGDSKLLEMASKDYPDHIVGYENWTCSGIERSVMPHLYSSTRRFNENDVIIHSRQVWINGYRAENERTFFVGQPSDEQRKCLQLAIDAQQAGMDMIKPGVKAKDVDIASFKVFEEEGYGEYVQHRIGHGLGLTEHEEPYLRFDNDLVLEEGMVYTIEPGIYVPGVGGFRHSDTVILTNDGCRSITQYPRKLDDLIF
ncbi:M24 family metallopeptidase [Pseudalkalibacillus decolorationis]|uniref:M24 family metallopeptidase n=1 Tax=Pseudalkalibacillus decolorationis TaxID=163879 RepID=UPI0021491E2E|nr:Xaa-Pro peptidase family protein [Pseudalkalibacillus decolorationis]